MQPTLFGVTVDPLYDPPLNAGTIHPHLPLYRTGRHLPPSHRPAGGSVVSVGPPEHFLRFANQETVNVRYEDGSLASIPIKFAPDSDPNNPHPAETFRARIGLANHPHFRKGEPIISFVETTGDHLFVDRMTYNFRRPQRGEIIVFQTKGIIFPGMDQSQFYIKRLVGLPGETVSIGEDRHVRINDRRLDSSTPHFANLYSFDPKIPPRDSHSLKDQNYNGHILLPDNSAHPRLQEESDTMVVEPDLVLGDNTYSISIPATGVLFPGKMLLAGPS